MNNLNLKSTLLATQQSSRQREKLQRLTGLPRQSCGLPCNDATSNHEHRSVQLRFPHCGTGKLLKK